MVRLLGHKTRYGLILALLCFFWGAPSNIEAAPGTKLHRGAIIVVKIANQQYTGDFTTPTLESLISTSPTSLKNYYETVSHGQEFHFDLFNNNGSAYTVPEGGPTGEQPCTSFASQTSLLQSVITAADPDIDYSKYTSLIFVFVSPGSACMQTGGGNLVFASSVDFTSAEFSGRLIVNIHNGYFWNFNLNLLHEFGHTLGLDHANSWTCSDGTIVYGKCTSNEYGDFFSVMGGKLHELNGPHRELLGWLTPPQITTVGDEGTYLLTSLETNTAAPKILKIPQSVNPSTGEVRSWYYLEYRSGQGEADKSLASTSVANGVLVHVFPPEFWGHVSTIAPTRILKMGSSGQWELPIGEKYTDSVSGISFTIINKTEAGLKVQVQFSNIKPCIRKNPSITIKPNLKNGKGGQLLKYTLALRNNNSIGCSVQKMKVTNLVSRTKWLLRINGKKDLTISVPSKQTKFIGLHIVSPKNIGKPKYQFTIQAVESGQPYKSTKKYYYGNLFPS